MDFYGLRQPKMCIIVRLRKAIDGVEGGGAQAGAGFSVAPTAVRRQLATAAAADCKCVPLCFRSRWPVLPVL
ncbi:Protein of unknown function [Gryllus bimaculatus]|nr:Protein of unknown function [Gryllus bimaculatus]